LCEYKLWIVKQIQQILEIVAIFVLLLAQIFPIFVTQLVKEQKFAISRNVQQKNTRKTFLYMKKKTYFQDSSYATQTILPQSGKTITNISHPQCEGLRIAD